MQYDAIYVHLWWHVVVLILVNFANIININQQWTENNKKASGFCCHFMSNWPKSRLPSILIFNFWNEIQVILSFIFTHSTAASSAAHIMCVDRDHLQSTGLKWVTTLFGHWSEVSEGVLLKWGLWHSTGSYCWCYIQRKAKFKPPPVISMLFLMLLQSITRSCADFDIIQLF